MWLKFLGILAVVFVLAFLRGLNGQPEPGQTDKQED